MTTDESTSIGKEFNLVDPSSATRARLIEYGATVTNIWCADRNGDEGDVLLGCRSPGDHAKPHPHFNCIVGRYANRITNAQFELNGTLYQLEANIPPHQLHGGSRGFANQLWKGTQTDNEVVFELGSKHGDAGFPGDLFVQATYTLANRVLKLELRAISNHATPICLTAHHYFNLSTKQGSHIGDHLISINADNYLPVSDDLTQLGQIESVKNSPFDLRDQIRLGDRLSDSHHQIQLADGFDHTFTLNGDGLREAARVIDPVSGRTLEIRTDQPGVQLYTCNTLAALGKNGVHYGKHQGLCLETQQFPDAPNHPNYPNAILQAGETWRAVTEYEFGVE